MSFGPHALGVLMIPTAFKAKIPHTHSYPLGAQTISEALEGVPQLAELNLSFWRAWQRYEQRGEPYSILKAQYSRMSSGISSSNAMMERECFVPRWTITVGAVPRTLRHSVQQRLIAVALPRIRSWLIANADATPRTGQLDLTFWFEETRDVIRAAESSTLEPARER